MIRICPSFQSAMTKLVIGNLRIPGLAFLILILLAACTAPTATPKPTQPVLAKEIVLYNWPDYLPQSVLDAFTNEYGVKIKYITFDSSEEATANIASSKVVFDVAVVDNDDLVSLIENELLADINLHNIPNFKNISPNFRDWAFDPGNRHSIPYNYGTTGLVVRSDLIQTPVRHWSDLWDEQYAGKIAIRAQPTELISVALRSLGYPLNSEDPSQLQAARDRLLVLKQRAHFVDADPATGVQALLDGDVAILLGWNGDARLAHDLNPNIEYVIPEEGTMLWGDSFAISAISPNRYTVEVFLNFLLRPEVGTEIVKANLYSTTNDMVRALLPDDLANDPLIYPPSELLIQNNFYQPHSPAGKKLYEDLWNQVMEEQ